MDNNKKEKGKENEINNKKDIYWQDYDFVKYDTQISNEDKKNLRGMLSSSFNISLDQISKTVKWNTNSITLMYNKHVVYQKKLNNVTFCHIICKEDDYNHIIVQNIGNN